MHTEDSPLVSVIIVYYKRPETIEAAIESALQQDYPRREILVIDNRSDDGLRELIERRGYDVRLIELPVNRGACGGRNAGIEAARGDIIVCSEDDVQFMSAFELTKVVNTFRERPDIGVLAFKIVDPKTGELRLREWCHPRYWKEASDQEFETDWFGEGASAFRREVFERCGAYYAPFFYGAEGDDLVVRIFNGGYRILYTPRIRVGHAASEAGRTSTRQYYFFTRNYVWTAFKNFAGFQRVKFIVPKLLMMLYFTLRSRSFGAFVRGLWHGVRGLAAVRQERAVATRETLRYMAELEKQRPTLLVRFARHKAAPQI
ncbi:MAG: glycosyltransferase family 2 protein [Terriglobales bacterium]